MVHGLSSQDKELLSFYIPYNVLLLVISSMKLL
jgi:hypothetical protein